MKSLIFWVLLIVGWLWISSSTDNSSSNYGYDYSTGNYYEPEYEEQYASGVVTSDNWVCTDDCSGHEAGYEWAEENGITDPYDCDGNSDSFIEGCEAYANEYLMEDEYEEDYYEDEYEY